MKDTLKDNTLCRKMGLASVVYKFFDKKTAGSDIKSIPQNEKLAEELHKPIVRKFKKGKYFQHSETLFGVLI